MTKQLIQTTLIFTLLCSSILTFSFATTVSTEQLTFADMPNHWGAPYVDALVKRKVINGFPDGTFRPQGTVTVAEFTKILVSSLEHEPKPVAPEKHWAQGYMDKALELGLTQSTEKEFRALNTPLTRGQLARMLYRAMPTTYAFKDLIYHQYMIKDYVECKDADRLAILNCFRSGIITGYPDGNFKDLLSVTRAEASAMMMRFLDESLRKTPELPYAEGMTITESDEKDRATFLINISVKHPLKPQYESLKHFLPKYLSNSIIREVITYISLKEDQNFDLKEKRFVQINNANLVVISRRGEAYITIRGD